MGVCKNVYNRCMVNTVLLFIFTVFSLASFSAILVGTDPYSASLFIRTLFFITLFFSFIGLFSISGLTLLSFRGKFKRVKFSEHASKGIEVGMIFRRSMLLAILASSLILLETFSVLNLGNALAMFILIVAVEMLVIYRRT